MPRVILLFQSGLDQIDMIIDAPQCQTSTESGSPKSAPMVAHLHSDKPTRTRSIMDNTRRAWSAWTCLLSRPGELHLLKW